MVRTKVVLTSHISVQVCTLFRWSWLPCCRSWTWCTSCWRRSTGSSSWWQAASTSSEQSSWRPARTVCRLKAGVYMRWYVKMQGPWLYKLTCIDIKCFEAGINILTGALVTLYLNRSESYLTPVGTIHGSLWHKLCKYEIMILKGVLNLRSSIFHDVIAPF